MKFSGTSPDGVILGFGLSDRNLQLLREGRPISVDLGEMLPGQTGKILIFWGENEQAMGDMLRGGVGPDTKIINEYPQGQEGWT